MNITITYQLVSNIYHKFIFNHIISNSITNNIIIITDPSDFPTKYTLELLIKYISNKDYKHNISYCNSKNCSIGNVIFALTICLNLK